MPLNPDDYRDRWVLVDGDYRLELSRRGWSDDAFPERANLARPELVRSAVDAFLDAGADILVANTAAANAAVLDPMLESGDVTERDLAAMNRRGVEIVRAALADHPAAAGKFVVGALGPSPHLLMLEEIDPAELLEAYLAQARVLAQAGAEALLCRSFRELDALRIAVDAGRSTGLPIIASMVFDCGPERTETTLGVTAPQACEVLAGAGAAIIGCDGGESPDHAPSVVALMRRLTDRTLWAQVNAGTAVLQDGRVTYSETPQEFAARIPALAEAGANFIGGAQGASADHIAALASFRLRASGGRGRRS